LLKEGDKSHIVNTTPTAGDETERTIAAKNMMEKFDRSFLLVAAL
jgi:hypothetical protein